MTAYMIEIFSIGGIVGIIGLVRTALFYYPPPRPHAVAHIPRGQLLRELDYLGLSNQGLLGRRWQLARLFLYAVGLTILRVGLYQSGNTKAQQ